MISGILAYRNIQNSILNGVKIPHSTSQPLIFGENGKYYLAVFVFFFSREDIEKGLVERPTMWAVADIEVLIPWRKATRFVIPRSEATWESRRTRLDHMVLPAKT